MSLSKQSSDKVWTIAAVFLALLLGWMIGQAYVLHAQGVLYQHSHLQIARANGTKATFRIEIATTQKEQEHGLMFRQRLAPDAGMIFVWAEDQPISMWMKDTLIPLDMLFVAKDGRIVKIVTNAKPNDLTPISSEVPVRAVIEIGGGEAVRQNIKAEDKVLYPAFSSTPGYGQ